MADDNFLMIYVAFEYPPRSQTFVLSEAEAVRCAGQDVLFYPMHLERDSPQPEWVVSWHNAAHPLVLGRAMLRLARTAIDRHRELSVQFRLPPHTFRQMLRSLKALLIAAALAGLIDKRAGKRSVHLHAHFFGLMSQVALFAKQMLEVDRVVTISIVGHAADAARPSSPVRLRHEVASADIVICASEFVKRHLELQTGESNSELIRCGIVKRRGGSPSTAQGALRVVAVGRLVEKKGFEVLIQACCSALAAGVDVSLLIVGDGPELKRLRSVIALVGMTDRVHLLGARTPSETLNIVRSEADCFALSCRVAEDGDVDGIPVALMEAMSMGIPVITTAVGGITELVRDGETGYVVPPDDALALSNALQRVAADPSEGRMIGRAGQAFVVSNFSQTTEAAKLLEVVHATQRRLSFMRPRGQRGIEVGTRRRDV